MSAAPGPNLLIGVGNPDRGDDAIGLEIARQARLAAPREITIIDCSRDASRLIDLWTGAGTVIVVDAAQSHSRPGTIHRFDACVAPLPTRLLRSSTHALGVAEAIELSRALHQLPQRLIVYGIEAVQFGFAAPITPEVRSAGLRVLEQTLAEFPSVLT